MASMFWPACTFTFVPNADSMPTCNVGVNAAPLARTKAAESTPYFLSDDDAVAQSSMAFAASAGFTSASASPWSQGIALSPGLPEQSSSPQTGVPPSGAGWSVSIAPGFTLGSQSLQSPAFGD